MTQDPFWKYVPFTQVTHIEVAPEQVLQLFVQAWQMPLIPVKPAGQGLMHAEVFLKREVPFTHESQSVAEEQVKQGETQAVHS